MGLLWDLEAVTIYGTPAEFAALVRDFEKTWANDLSNLATLVHPVYSLILGNGLFHVHGWPVAPDAASVTVRINATGKDTVDLDRRSPRKFYGWIDARKLPTLPGGVPETKLTVSIPSLLGGNQAANIGAGYAWRLLLEELAAEGFIDDPGQRAPFDEPPAIPPVPEGPAEHEPTKTKGPLDRQSEIAGRRQTVKDQWQAREPGSTTEAFKRKVAYELAVSESTIRDDLKFLKEAKQIE